MAPDRGGRGRSGEAGRGAREVIVPGGAPRLEAGRRVPARRPDLEALLPSSQFLAGVLPPLASLLLKLFPVAENPQLHVFSLLLFGQTRKHAASCPVPLLLPMRAACAPPPPPWSPGTALQGPTLAPSPASTPPAPAQALQRLFINN